MEHTHEYDCVVCGAHFDSQEALHKHDQAQHAPKQPIDIHASAEPTGNERLRHAPDPDDRTR